MLKIYGKQSCPYCVMAKQFCDVQGIDYEYYGLEDFPDIREIIYAAGRRTFPCIFDGGELVGGYDELVDTYTMF